MKFTLILTLALALPQEALGFSTGFSTSSTKATVTAEESRREALNKGVAFLGAAAGIAGLTAGKAEALDMDAFEKQLIAADEKNCDPKRDPKCKPNLSPDEALCQYGQGAKKSEACKRAKAAGGDTTQRGGGKSLGGAYAM